MQKELTEAEQAQMLEYRRAQRRAYWDRMPTEEKKARRRKAQGDFWGKMTAEERRAKRRQYDLQRAIRAAARAAEKGD